MSENPCATKGFVQLGWTKVQSSAVLNQASYSADGILQDFVPNILFLLNGLVIVLLLVIYLTGLVKHL